jgi:hypothetical protein
MKSSVMPSFIQMEDDELKKLTTEVRETLAIDVTIKPAPARKFAESDMWNILNARKTAYWMMRRNRH